MLKFKVTPERCAEALSILEFKILESDKYAAVRMLHLFLLDGNNDYAVSVTLDEDGDPVRKNDSEALNKVITSINSKRLEKLANELAEAIKQIVNPPKDEGLSKPSSMDSPAPPAG